MNSIIESQSFDATDGASIRYKSRISAGGGERALVLLHRGHEHADRWDCVVPGLEMPETALFAWDARGHGGSEGKRGHSG
jgi:alpha-beta hydrolase superfamily lysophospholipase